MSKTLRHPEAAQQAILDSVQVRLVKETELKRFDRLLDQHHYLGSVKPVGERLHYVATDTKDDWLALLLFSAPARHLKHREKWIGWSHEQRRRRLSLITNNTRFLLLPKPPIVNLGSKVLSLTLARLPEDWQARYAHPVLVVETFVDPAQFCGTVYTAAGWIELGQTEGWGRKRRDYYVKHDKPKRLFVRALRRNATRSLQAEHLTPELAVVQEAVPARCTQRVPQLRSLVEHLKGVPDLRARVESYPLWSLLAIQLLAHLAGAPRGQKDLAVFAGNLSQAQRRALGVRCNRHGHYPAPSQPTFFRMQRQVSVQRIAQIFGDIQLQLRGACPANELIVLDGKEPKHGSGDSILTAVSVPSGHFLGCARVDTDKTNEIPVARALFGELDLTGRTVSLDALHTCRETAHDLVQGAGADYLLTVKDNHPELRQPIEKLVTAPAADFPPSTSHAHPGSDRRDQQMPSGRSLPALGGNER